MLEGCRLQQNRTYFSELFGLGWVFVALFAIGFYLVCFLFAKGQVNTTVSLAVLATYWSASILYLTKKIANELPRMYGATIRRMRLYSFLRWAVQWYVGYSLFFLSFLLYFLSSFRANMLHAIASYSPKLLLAAYGMSLFTIVFLFTAICNVLAESRGTRCSCACKSQKH